MHFFPVGIIPYVVIFLECFNQAGRSYFMGFLWGFLACTDKKTLTRIAGSCPFLFRHISGWSRFLAKSKWSLEVLQDRLVQFIISLLGDELLFRQQYLVASIDTSLMAIFGKKMAGVQRWHDHSGNADRGGYIRGHHWGLIGLLVCRTKQWICLPIIARLIFGKQEPAWICGQEGIQKASFWDQSLALCFDLARKVKHPLIIVADAYFSKAPFIKGLREKNIILVSRLRNDAVGWKKLPPQREKRRGRPKIKGDERRLRSLLKSMPVQTARILRYGKEEAVYFVSTELFLRQVPFPVKVVVVKTASNPLILVCSSVTISAEDIIHLYAARFSIETAIEQMKGSLGWSDYQCYTSIAFHRFVNLICFAASWWKTLSLCIPVSSWCKNFFPKPYINQTQTSFGLMRQVVRQYALQQLIFSKFALRANLLKNTRLRLQLIHLTS
jgi:hypothetical protein